MFLLLTSSYKNLPGLKYFFRTVKLLSGNTLPRLLFFRHIWLICWMILGKNYWFESIDLTWNRRTVVLFIICFFFIVCVRDNEIVCALSLYHYNAVRMDFTFIWKYTFLFYTSIGVVLNPVLAKWSHVQSDSRISVRFYSAERILSAATPLGLTIIALSKECFAIY